MEFMLFLIRALWISCSGALQPGPVTASAIAIGTRNRYAGAIMSIGHGLIEIPLIILIMAGLDKILKAKAAQITIGLAGGAVLVFMGVQMWLSLGAKTQTAAKQPRLDNPLWAGMVLTASNPFFLVWWATTGLALAMEASTWGVWAFGIFAFTHWMVDLVWLQVLSWTSYKGADISEKVLRIVLRICAIAMCYFGVRFIYKTSILINEIVSKSG